MSTTRKIMIGVGLASGALLAAWLLTGSRKEKTKAFVAKSAKKIGQTLKTEKQEKIHEDSDVHYI
jgi:3-polyprenyl-4-hydroxybenzoate decarboxylase